jgi:hypothetical protein
MAPRFIVAKVSLVETMVFWTPQLLNQIQISTGQLLTVLGQFLALSAWIALETGMCLEREPSPLHLPLFVDTRATPVRCIILVYVSSCFKVGVQCSSVEPTHGNYCFSCQLQRSSLLACICTLPEEYNSGMWIDAVWTDWFSFSASLTEILVNKEERKVGWSLGKIIESLRVCKHWVHLYLSWMPLGKVQIGLGISQGMPSW